MLVKPFGILILLLTSLHTAAEEFTLPTLEDRFQIEYILFTHGTPGADEINLNAKRYKTTDKSQLTHLISGFDQLSSFQYPLIHRDNMTLNEVLTNLTRSKDVQVINYGAWQQEIMPDSTLPPININSLVQTQSGLTSYNESRLEGYLTVKRSRYMHINAELYLSDYNFYPGGNIQNLLLEKQNPALNLLWMLIPYSKQEMILHHESAIRLPNNIKQLHQSRRLKYGEVHYLDHPALGVIVTINKVEVENEDAF